MILLSGNQEWQFHIGTWQVVVKNGNYHTLLLTSRGEECQLYTMLLTFSSGQEWQTSHCHMISSSSRMTILHIATDYLLKKNGNFIHCYWHLVGRRLANVTLLLTSSSLRNGNFTLPQISSGQRMTILHIATDYLLKKNGNFIQLLTSSGEEMPMLHIATYYLVVKNDNFTHCYWLCTEQ